MTILDKNKGLLLKKAQENNLSLHQTFNLIKFAPNIRKKQISNKNADLLILKEKLIKEGIMTRCKK